MFLLLLHVFLSGLLAEEPDLGLHVREGQVLHYRLSDRLVVEHESSLSKSARRDETETLTDQELVVVKKEPSGWRFRLTTTRLKVSGSASGLNLDYDSERGDPPPNLKEHPAYSGARTLGAPIDFLVNASNAIGDLHLSERFLETFKQIVPNQDAIGMLDVSGLAASQTVAGFFVPRPTWRPHKQCSWSTRTRLFASEGFELDLRTTYSLSSPSLRAGLPVLVVHMKSIPAMSLPEGIQAAVNLEVHGETSTTLYVDPGSGMVVAADGTGSNSVTWAAGSGASQGKQANVDHSQTRLELIEAR